MLLCHSPCSPCCLLFAVYCGCAELNRVNLRCAKEADHADSCLRDDYEDDYKYGK